MLEYLKVMMKMRMEVKGQSVVEVRLMDTKDSLMVHKVRDMMVGMKVRMKVDKRAQKRVSMMAGKMVDMVEALKVMNWLMER